MKAFAGSLAVLFVKIRRKSLQNQPTFLKILAV